MIISTSKGQRDPLMCQWMKLYMIYVMKLSALCFIVDSQTMETEPTDRQTVAPDYNY